MRRQGRPWVTQGQSLNISPNVEAEAPSIDFSRHGQDRAWVSWYQPERGARLRDTDLSAAASPHDDASYQGSGSRFSMPSLDVHTDKEAETIQSPVRTTVPAQRFQITVGWHRQEQDGNIDSWSPTDQIFVSKASPSGPEPVHQLQGVLSEQRQHVLLADGGFRPLAGEQQFWPSGRIQRSTSTPSRDGSSPTSPSPARATRLAYGRLVRGTAPASSRLHGETVRCSRPSRQPTQPPTVASTGRRIGEVDRSSNILDTSSPPGYESLRSVDRATEEYVWLNADPEQGRGTRTRAHRMRTLCQPHHRAPRACRGSCRRKEQRLRKDGAAIFVARLVGRDHFELFDGGQPVSEPRCRRPEHHVLRRHTVRLVGSRIRAASGADSSAVSSTACVQDTLPSGLH